MTENKISSGKLDSGPRLSLDAKCRKCVFKIIVYNVQCRSTSLVHRCVMLCSLANTSNQSSATSMQYHLQAFKKIVIEHCGCCVRFETV